MTDSQFNSIQFNSIQLNSQRERERERERERGEFGRVWIILISLSFIDSPHQHTWTCSWYPFSFFFFFDKKTFFNDAFVDIFLFSDNYWSISPPRILFLFFNYPILFIFLKVLISQIDKRIVFSMRSSNFKL